MPCYAIALLQDQSTLMFRQNTRPCAIDLVHDHTVTLYKSTLDVRQSQFSAPLLIQPIKYGARPISYPIQQPLKKPLTMEGVLESQKPGLKIFQITFDKSMLNLLNNISMSMAYRMYQVMTWPVKSRNLRITSSQADC